jgi:hypothetical protein
MTCRRFRGRDKPAIHWNSAALGRVCFSRSNPTPEEREHEGTIIDYNRHRLDAWNCGLRPVAERAAKKRPAASGAKPTEFKSDELQFAGTIYVFSGAVGAILVGDFFSEFSAVCPKHPIGPCRITAAASQHDWPVGPEHDRPRSGAVE